MITVFFPEMKEQYSSNWYLSLSKSNIHVYFLLELSLLQITLPPSSRIIPSCILKV